MIRVELPIPPSVNSMSYKGRIPKAHYRQWKRDAGWELKLANVGTLPPGGYTFRLLVNDKMRGDVSNRIKAAEDLLVACGITPDDRHCTDSSAGRDPSVPKGRCVIIVEQSTLL